MELRKLINKNKIRERGPLEREAKKAVQEGRHEESNQALVDY
jgi:hypothetical protein